MYPKMSGRHFGVINYFQHPLDLKKINHLKNNKWVNREMNPSQLVIKL